MRLEKIFTKRFHSLPNDVDTIGHQLAIRGGYIHQTGAGVYTFSPIGLKTLKNIENLVGKEMNNLNCQEILMPITSPASLWEDSGRYNSVDVLLKFKNRASTNFVLNPTHEEIVVDYARNCLESYKQLPFSLYQIQTKYRDELRVRAGLIRCREFIMKDAYSFHANAEDLNEFYGKMLLTYGRIYKKLGLKDVVSVLAPTGDMGGKISHEFQMISSIGEDTIYMCKSCNYKSNKEIFSNLTFEDTVICPECGGNLNKIRGVEIGNIFQLGDKYTKSMDVSYIDKDGSKKYPLMGCYGIGISRVLACILEQAELGKSMWNMNIAPYKVHIITIGNSDYVRDASNNIYENLNKNKIDIVIDDGSDRPGSKFMNADLLGSPIRIILSDKNVLNNVAEMKYYNLKNNYPDFVKLDSVLELIRNIIKDEII